MRRSVSESDFGISVSVTSFAPCMYPKSFMKDLFGVCGLLKRKNLPSEKIELSWIENWAISKTSRQRFCTCRLSFTTNQCVWIKFTARLLYLVIVTVAHFVEGYLRTYFCTSFTNFRLTKIQTKVIMINKKTKKGKHLLLINKSLTKKVKYLIVRSSLKHRVGSALIARPHLFHLLGLRTAWAERPNHLLLPQLLLLLWSLKQQQVERQTSSAFAHSFHSTAGWIMVTLPPCTLHWPPDLCNTNRQFCALCNSSTFQITDDIHLPHIWWKESRKETGNFRAWSKKGIGVSTPEIRLLGCNMCGTKW